MALQTERAASATRRPPQECVQLGGERPEDNPSLADPQPRLAAFAAAKRAHREAVDLGASAGVSLAALSLRMIRRARRLQIEAVAS